jgi:hypothetical protein
VTQAPATQAAWRIKSRRCAALGLGCTRETLHELRSPSNRKVARGNNR